MLPPWARNLQPRKYDREFRESNDADENL